LRLKVNVGPITFQVKKTSYGTMDKSKPKLYTKLVSNNLPKINS